MALLGGCASGYMASNLFGGYVERWVDDDTVRVEFGGNGYTDVARARDFAVLRAAELCLEQGADGLHIRDLDAYDETTHTIGIGGAPSSTQVRPHASVLADCVDLPHPDAYVAVDVQREIRAHYELGPAEAPRTRT